MSRLMLEANAGRAGLPRMFTAGLGFTHPGGFGSGNRNEPTTEAEARELVREQAALGAHFVKMWVNEVPEPGLKITPEIRNAIIDEAITNGLVPVAHIDEEADGLQLIEAGLKDFLHSTVRTFGPGAGVPMDDPRPSQEFLRLAARQRHRLLADPVDQPEQLAFRRASRAAGRPGTARGDEPGCPRQLG